MDNIGYLSQNGLTRYPFKDTCSLQFGSFFLPTDAVLDLLFVSKVSTGRRAYIRSFSKTSDSFVFIFSDPDRYADWGTVTIPFTDIVEYDFVAYDFASFAIKLVPGPGLTRLESSANFSYNFSPDVAEVCASAFVLRPPMVTSLIFQNLDTAVTSITGDLTLAAGTNIFMQQDSGIGLNVKPGAGQGKFNPCGDLDGIRTINGNGPNQDGSFTLAFPACYTWTPGAVGTLHLANHCEAPCNPTAMGEVAHYENRIGDAVVQLTAYLESVQQTTKAAIEAILAALSTTVFYKWEHLITAKPDTTRMFVSVNVMIYNPSAQEATVTLFRTTDLTLVKEDASKTFVIPCKSHAVFKYVGTTTASNATMSVGGTWALNDGVSSGNLITDTINLVNPTSGGSASSGSGHLVYF